MDSFILDGINEIIQQQLDASSNTRKIHLRVAQDMGVDFVVDDQIYHEISQIEDSQIQELIHGATQELEANPLTPLTSKDEGVDPELERKLIDLAESLVHSREVDKEEITEIRDAVQDAIDPAKFVARRHKGSGGDFLAALVSEMSAFSSMSCLQYKLVGVLVPLSFPVFPLVFGGWLALTGRFRRTFAWLKGLWAVSTLIIAVVLAGSLDRVYQECGWSLFSFLADDCSPPGLVPTCVGRSGFGYKRLCQRTDHEVVGSERW